MKPTRKRKADDLVESTIGTNGLESSDDDDSDMESEESNEMEKDDDSDVDDDAADESSDEDGEESIEEDQDEEDSESENFTVSIVFLAMLRFIPFYSYFVPVKFLL